MTRRENGVGGGGIKGERLTDSLPTFLLWSAFHWLMFWASIPSIRVQTANLLSVLHLPCSHSVVPEVNGFILYMSSTVYLQTLWDVSFSFRSNISLKTDKHASQCFCVSVIRTKRLFKLRCQERIQIKWQKYRNSQTKNEQRNNAWSTLVAWRLHDISVLNILQTLFLAEVNPQAFLPSFHVSLPVGKTLIIVIVRVLPLLNKIKSSQIQWRVIPWRFEIPFSNFENVWV